MNASTLDDFLDFVKDKRTCRKVLVDLGCVYVKDLPDGLVMYKYEGEELLFQRTSSGLELYAVCTREEKEK